MTNDQNLGDDLNQPRPDTPTNPTGFSDSTQQNADAFSQDAQRAADNLENNMNVASKEGKTIALIAHLTLIGWIIALVMNNNSKSEFGSFYIRQVLGLGLCGLVLSFIPLLGWIVSLGIFVLWIMSLISALNGEKKLTPLLGAQFQEWFKSL